jgi:hypothetical protein
MGLILFIIVLTVFLDVRQISKSQLQKPVHA